MFKKALFQLHWILGISAGIVLAMVGMSGALLSYKDLILDWLNGDAYVVNSSAAVLDKTQLIAAITRQLPGKRVISLTFSPEPNRAVRISLTDKRAEKERVQSGADNKPAPAKRERRYVNPFTGSLLQTAQGRGDAFFAATEQFHRNLLAGANGKALVGASTIVLVFMALSGLYLRWPRRPLDWRAWLKMSLRLRGRAFWLRLHSVLGTYVLISYLLLALTGLFFAYPWYRAALVNLVGAQLPSRGPTALSDLDIGPPDAERVWQSFQGLHVSFTSAELSIPERPTQAAEVRYLPADAVHERAFNRLVVRPDTGEVLRHERFEDKGAPDRFIASMFPLHAGSYFGPLGVFVTMLASLAMPIFAVSGWILYLGRRARARNDALAPSTMIIDSK